MVYVVSTQILKLCRTAGTNHCHAVQPRPADALQDPKSYELIQTFGEATSKGEDAENGPSLSVKSEDSKSSQIQTIGLLR